jgi:glutathione S-transferase
MLATPDIILTAAVTLLAILITTAFAIAVSRARRRLGVEPPAITGPEELERIVRIHANTTEAMVLFVPALWLAASYFRGWLPALIGLVWCLGRILYGMGYRVAAARRLPGFIISQLAMLALVILAIWGLITAWGVATAT